MKKEQTTDAKSDYELTMNIAAMISDLSNAQDLTQGLSRSITYAGITKKTDKALGFGLADIQISELEIHLEDALSNTAV